MAGVQDLVGMTLRTGLPLERARRTEIRRNRCLCLAGYGKYPADAWGWHVRQPGVCIDPDKRICDTVRSDSKGSGAKFPVLLLQPHAIAVDLSFRRGAATPPCRGAGFVLPSSAESAWSTSRSGSS